MKRFVLACSLVALAIGLASTASAQLGTNFFKKPNIADIFRPEVGKGAAYEMKDKDGKARTMEMSVVGKDVVEGKEAYWMEIAHNGENAEGMAYVKMLLTKDDFQPHRMIMQQPGKQAMEIPMNPMMKSHTKMNDEMEKWKSAGTETITVPAGTFVCEHWTKEGGKEDVWASSKVSPMGLVKQVSEHSTMTLVKVISDAKDHITGTPQVFDPAMLRQQMMEKMQKDHPKP